jgi:hypothetical protein
MTDDSYGPTNASIQPHREEETEGRTWKLIGADHTRQPPETIPCGCEMPSNPTKSDKSDKIRQSKFLVKT